MFQLRHPARQLLIGRRQLCDPRLPRLAARDQLRDPHGLHPDERDQLIAGQTIQTGHEQIKATLRPAPSTDTPTTPRNPPPPVAVTDRYQQAATDTLRAGTECLPATALLWNSSPQTTIQSGWLQRHSYPSKC